MNPLAVLLLVLPGQPALAEGLAVKPESCRVVLAAITESAQRVSRLPGPKPPDELTRLYLQAAARAALTLPASEQAGAFCLALALGLDDSDVLVGKPFLGPFLRRIDPDETRKARKQLLGAPSLQGRRDWCQHFVVSAGLTVLGGSEAARAAGLLKERLDARPGGSGFSLADYAADEAGIRLVELLREDPARLKGLAEKGDLSGLLPALKTLPEGWSEEEIAKKFGGLDDPKFVAELAKVREIVRKCPGLSAPSP